MVRRDQWQFNTRGSRGCGKQHATTTLAHLFKSKFELYCPLHAERSMLDYVKREEARQNFIIAAEASFEHYKETGLHISLDEFSSWVDQAQQDPGAPAPACHT